MDAPITPLANNTASPLHRTIVEAQRLRLQNPVRYGVKGARPGDANYVKNGWRLALSDAAATRRQVQGAQAGQKHDSRLTAEQQLILIEYHHKLHLLQAHYFPLLGRELSNKAKRVASRVPAPASQVTALPTTVVAPSAPDVTTTSSVLTARVCRTPPPMPLAESLLRPPPQAPPPPPPAPVVEESTTEQAAGELRRSKRLRNPSQAAEAVQEKSLGA